jgi:acyl-coenzyme A synthetase/AMP-(fatty) acid ligase/acyl carrier protein
MIEHGAIGNTVYAQQQLFGVKAHDHHLQFASPCFDASVSEIFVCFASQGSLYIIKEEDRKNPLLLEQYLQQHSITIATLPPAYLRQMNIAKLSVLRTLVTAGEAADPNTAKKFLEYGNYLNAYGPTESSICATVFHIDKGAQVEGMKTVPIGKPIANTSIFILDEDHHPVAVNGPGEIYIAGKGLARGYLNQPTLTAEKFMKHPSCDVRIYRTGDIGRWLPDGNIEFIGRKDEQVKIRGYRVELGEIENALLQYPGITSAVVISRSNRKSENELIAYLLSNVELNASLIRDHISERLPDYMMPTHFIQLQSLPVNTSGKIDKRALPDPEGINIPTGVSYVAPRNEIEEKLVSIWSDLLEVEKERIGIRDDFFTLGGHSLKATRLAAQIHKEFEIQIDLRELFANPTIEILGNSIRAERWVEKSNNVLVEDRNIFEI